MKYNFCTVFDKNYLPRAVTLHSSCVQQCGDDFTLTMLCLDPTAKEILTKLALKNVQVMDIDGLRDVELIQARSTRSNGELAWTSKSVLLGHVLQNSTEDDLVAFLDCDTFLFSSPKPAYEELGQRSIMLTPHRFSGEEKKKEDQVGTFNAGMIFMRKTPTTLACLERWRKQCLEWCFAKYEPGRYGDQKYLDEWPSFYGDEIVISKNKGINAGPWNLLMSKIRMDKNSIYLDENKLVIYHFHALNIYFNKKGSLRTYPVSVIHSGIYPPYIVALRNTYSTLRILFPEYQPKVDVHLDFLRYVKQIVQRKYLNFKKR